MPRTSNSKNSTYYHYLIRVYDNNEKDNLIEQKYIKTQKDLEEQYSLNRSAIYYLLNPPEGRKPRKYLNIELEKVLIPIYKNVMTFENDLLPLTPPISSN